MTLSKSIDFLLENAGAVIQYRLRKKILRECKLKAPTQNLPGHSTGLMVLSRFSYLYRLGSYQPQSSHSGSADAPKPKPPKSPKPPIISSR